MRILIVDDNEMALEMLQFSLEQAGHEVFCAHNGREALAILAEGMCRLVISDWEMPEMNGIELTRAIRTSDFAGYVYVILLTSRDAANDTIEGLSAGADDFITKPFNPGELAVRVRTGERILGLEMRDLTIFALAKLAESRDPETGAHLERVQNYSRVLATHLMHEPAFAQEVDASFVRLIYQTSPLHDIGKVGIPDAVLLKAGRLTPEEYAIMKLHTLKGADTLEAALKEHPGASFLQMARDIALCHHERWDGAGYPHQLAGTKIPLCGRIVAVADVYDALTSKRVYKDAYSHATARQMIVDGAGAHFDPALVKAFLACENEFLSIRQRFATGDEAVPMDEMAA
jgi:putative two-component system response regulator